MSFEDDDTTEAHEKRITRCNSCRAQVIWLPTREGRAVPLDAHTVMPADDEYIPEQHGLHTTTCPTPRHRGSSR